MSVLTIWCNRCDGEHLISELMSNWDEISSGKSDRLNEICSKELFVEQVGIKYNASGSYISILFDNQLDNDEIAILSSKIRTFEGNYRE